jgi:stage III sporulation protein AE
VGEESPVGRGFSVGEGLPVVQEHIGVLRVRLTRKAVRTAVMISAIMIFSLTLFSACKVNASSAQTVPTVPGQGHDESPAPASSWSSSLEGLQRDGVTEPIDRVFKDLLKDHEISWRQIVGNIMSGKGIDFLGILKSLATGATREFLASGSLFGKIMLIGVSVACLEILSETISPSGSNRIAIWACHISLVTLAMWSFNDVLRIAKDATEAIRTAFFSFIPALTTLSVVSAAPVTASILHPLVFGVGTAVCIIVLDAAFPVIYTSIALDLAGNLGGGERVSGVAGMLRQLAFLVVGISMACFVGIVMGQRAATGLADGMAYRTAKYVSSTFIPVAGKAIGDTMDMFFVSAYGLRSAMGLAGAVAVVSVVFTPLLRVLGCLFMWKVSAAILGPIAGQQVSRSLRSMADGITAVSITLFVTCFVFTICLSLVAQATKPF